MLSLAQFDLPVLALAVLIGMATGRWMFRGAPARKPREDKGSP